MKITDVEAIPLVVPMMEGSIKAPISLPYADDLAKVVFKEYRTVVVKVHTDEGITGIGECMVRLAPVAYKDIIEYIKPVLIGANPFNIELLWDKLYGVMMNRGHYKGFYIEAISGIDLALWDIMGKALNVPVYQLLGGKTHERIWTYASSLRFRDMKTILADAERYLELGFNAMKIKIGQNPDNYRADIEVVRQVRKAVGDQVVLMADANCGYNRDVKTALEVGRALEDLGVYWFEEPVSPDHYEGYERLAHSLDIRIAGGEAEFTRHGFRQLLLRKAIDVVQPNVCRAGGFTECKKITALSSAFHIPYAPHTGSSSAICMAASLHLAVAEPGFLIYEYMMSDWNKSQKNPLRWELVQLPIKSFNNGYIEVDEKPGLGIELNEEIIKRYAV